MNPISRAPKFIQGYVLRQTQLLGAAVRDAGTNCSDPFVSRTGNQAAATALLTTHTIGASIIRIGFLKAHYYSYSTEPPTWYW